MKNTFKYKIMDGDKIFWFFGGMFNENTPVADDYLHNENGWLHGFYSLTKYDKEVKDILIRYSFLKQIVYNKESDYNHIEEMVLLHFSKDKKYLK